MNEALEKLREFGAQRPSLMPALTESMLADVEKSLGVALPPSYRQFLLGAREYGLHFEEFLWPGTDLDLVAINIEERSVGLPTFLISFLSDGYGTQICFDTRFTDALGEHRIVEWERGMAEETLIDEELEPIANDFTSWLITMLQHEIEDLRDMDDA